MYLGNRQFCVFLNEKSSQEFLANDDFPQGSILGRALLLSIHAVPDDIFCSVAISSDNTTHYCGWNRVSDKWQQLDLVSELICYLRDTVDWDRKGLVLSLLRPSSGR